jgi:protein-S-isoprenylcysteine O-methyltransferase Ste14
MVTLGLVVVIGAWVLMLVIVGARHVRLATPAARRRTSSRAGLLLQLVAYLLAFGVNPVPVRPFGAWGIPAPVATTLASVLCVTGASLVVWSQHVLGVQWSLTARLIEQHTLVTTGPYAFVRHPVYAAMSLMLVGTGLALASPTVVIAALTLYAVGTVARVRAEERLMQEALGAEWAAYRRRVKALLPGVL